MRTIRDAVVAGILILMVAGCGPQDHSHDADGGHPHETGEGQDQEAAMERPTIAVTNWTDRSELFMEYPALVAGEKGRYAIHVTDLSGFTPLTTGEAEVVLRSSDGRESTFRGGISRPGIFGVDVTPAVAGEFEMSLRVDSPDLQDTHELGPVTVQEAGHQFPPEAEEDDGGISFLKEQQWTLEFGTEPVAVRDLQAGLVIPGTVRPRAGGEAVLSAPVAGRIDPSSAVPVPGERVQANRVLARIVPRSEALRDPAGLRADLVEAEQDYELAKQERDRAARLVESRALPARRLSEAEAAVTASKARLDAASQRLGRLDALNQSGEAAWGDDWFTVRAPFDGVASSVAFTSGASVEEGDLLLRLVDIRKVHVVGAVPESRASELGSLDGAELLLDGRPPIPLGKAVAIGEMVDPATRTVEVRYALDNREHRLLVGGAVRLRLFVGQNEALPAVPESAVIDDGGRPVVFVQSGGESFQRRPVRLGSREAGYVHVLEGVETGEHVVSRGAYLIRLAAMSTQIPAHGHVH